MEQLIKDVSTRAGITPDQVKTDHVEIQPDEQMATTPTLPTDPIPHPDQETNSILDNLRSGKEERSLGEQVINENEIPEVLVKKTRKATHEELMSFATTIMDLNDAKTKEKLDAMTDEELSKELNYEVAAD